MPALSSRIIKIIYFFLWSSVVVSRNRFRTSSTRWKVNHVISICLSITAEFYSKTQGKLQFELLPIHFAVWLISQRRKMIFLVNYSVVDERYLDSLFDQCKTGACHQCQKKIKAIKKVYTYIRFCPWLVLRKHTFHWFINQCRSSKRNKTYHTAGHTRLCSEWTLGLANPVLDPSGGMSFRAATSWKIENFNENLWFPILGFLQTASWSYYTIIPSHIDQAMPIRAQIKTPFFEEK